MNSKKVTGFGNLISNQKILDYISSVSFKKPTSVQNECIPELLKNQNVSIQGRTGSGKTLGYLLPMIQKLKEREDRDKEENNAEPKAIIILPTRELALQVFSITKGISHFARMRVRKLVGGDKGQSLNTLFSSTMDILITTPDRCLRALQNKELKVSVLDYLILDEADQLLEPSFAKTMSAITAFIKFRQTQVALVSASRPANFNEIIEGFFPNQKFVTVGKGQENVLNHKVKTFNIALEEEKKFSYVNAFIDKQQKRNGLVFMGNKARAKRVFEQLQQTGHKKLFLLHKDLEIKDRVKVVDEFRKKGGVLVSTDIFARGIDITHLEWVLNFDLPSEPDYYLHRSGRVGRAGRHGDVYNFITSKDVSRQKKINSALVIQGRSDLNITHKSQMKNSTKNDVKNIEKSHKRRSR